MDEASKIVADLGRKLEELDYKVVQYRQEMCTEFEKCTKELLCNVSQDVSVNVTKAITASFKKYHNLFPELQDAITTPPDHQKKRGGSPSTLGDHKYSHASQDEQPRSPHEREREFTGVFTPSYLPLLDSTDRHERRSSQEMSQVQQSEAEKSGTSNSPVMQTIISDPDHPSTPTVILQRPPTPLRKNTDSSIHSVVSNSSDSDSTHRKSALRRTSSSASHNFLSPRRVRFSLEGQEYPTDSSPKPPPIREEPPKRNAIILGFHEDRFGEDSDDEAGTELVEDIDKPPPKRISSSQALRALSRAPLEDEDGTKWTMVAAPPDGSASVPVDPAITTAKAYIDADEDEEEAEDNGGAVTGAEVDESQEGGSQKLSQAQVNESQKPKTSQKAPENEKTLSASLPIKFPTSEQSKMSSTSSAKSQIISGPSQSIPTPTAMKRKKSTFTFAESDSESDEEEENDAGKLNEDDDDLFSFEDGDESRNKENDPGTPKSKADADISRFSPSDLRSPRMMPGLGTSMRGGSLSRSFDGAYDVAESSNTQKVGTPSGIDYSYKGSKNHTHPFNRPVVSERVHREAKQMGEIHSWVGSVDGRSGVDDRPGDSGFRGSLGGMAGSLREGGRPRSFSEKLMMEEEMEKARAKK